MSTVTQQDIVRIPRLYAIGKRPLSLLLNWGELSYTRLIDGNKPSPQHEAELQAILEDPAVYAYRLEVGRDRVTQAAYERSLQAVNGLLEDQGGVARATRVFVVADRLCSLSGGDLTPSALQRLVYYVQGTSLARLGVALFDDLPKAAESGPMYDRIARVYSFDEIQRAAAAPLEANLSSDEKKVIGVAYKRYGQYSGTVLSETSRDEAPWKKTRKRCSDGDDLPEISSKSIAKYFSKSK